VCATKKQYCSPLMASIHETAEKLHPGGLMETRTMWEFDELCLAPPQPDCDPGVEV
jgi:putative transcriptional regulator